MRVYMVMASLMLTASSGTVHLAAFAFARDGGVESHHGPDREIVAAERHVNSMLDRSRNGVVGGQAPALQRLHVAALQVVSEVGLLRDQDLILLHELQRPLRRKNREVAEIMPVVVARIVVQHCIERIHGHGNGRVADGVDAELPAELVALLDVRMDLLRREERPPAESRLSFVIYQRPMPSGR